MNHRLCFLLLTFIQSFSLVRSIADSEHLLSFKASTDHTNALSTWSNTSQLCTSWLGVTCTNNNNNSNKNRVTHLVLESLDLSGSIDPLAHLTHLRLLSLKNNALFSSASLDLSPLKNIKLLYLSRNQFSGDFVNSAKIPLLRRLRRVDLSHNRLSGKIPVSQLIGLPHLITLRLEGNSFSGSLDLGSVVGFKGFKEGLVDFNVSSNELSGQIPEALSVFDSSCFGDNKNLCGKPLLISCDDPMPIKMIPDQKEGKKLNRRTIAAIFAVYVVGVAAVIAGVWLYCRRRRDRNWGGEKSRKVGEFNNKAKEDDVEIVFFEGYKGFRVEDLLKSSAEMLGKGSVGTTYKVVMDSGDVVVVKRAKRMRKKREIECLLRVIGGLRHRNLMNLRAYYCSRDELLLVYDFVAKGSLHSLLHGNRGPWRTPLDWMKRLKLASGLAEGLAFLHHGCKVKLSHGHLTSSNVLVDEEGNACISDVALRQLFDSSISSNSSSHGNLESQVVKHGYGGRKFSQKSDVYDFGLILLEVLTGKTVSNGEGGTSLIKWVQSVGRGELASEVFDFELLSYKEMEEEMVALLQVAFLCLTPLPQDRPKMNSVFKMIEDIRARGSRDFSISQSTSDLSSSPSLSEDANPLH
ncbi:hypothetical protein Scep_007763 [Stephania cephalantha]|uniref:Protein kinase domain-containing protein n=1 Tax=Stephania cephalantha TaxID=152367 RepID=A0AAP0PQC6_9MAGN